VGGVVVVVVVGEGIDVIIVGIVA